MRTCDICHESIIDEDGSKVVDDREMPLLAHVKCWLDFQTKETKYQNKITVTDTVGELKALIHDLPDDMPVRKILPGRRETSPVVAVEPRKDKTFVLEIRS